MMVQAIYSQNQHLQNRVEEFVASIDDSFIAVHNKFNTIGANIKQILGRPYMRKREVIHNGNDNTEELHEGSSDKAKPPLYV